MRSGYRALMGMVLCGALLAGCGGDNQSSKSTTGGAASKLKGEVKIDGSSTVAPISQAAAEMFRAEQPEVDVHVGISGTGGGFKKFLDKDAKLRTDINDASRPIKPAEMETAKSLGVEYVEIPIALDGLSVVVNKNNNFCDHLTVAELKRIWEPESKINNWSEVRQGFPDLPLKLFGPGTDSGTFDYFTEVINGKEKASRSDYTQSEDDNALVQGVAGTAGGLGYFGFSYYEANMDKLKLVGIDPGDGQAVKPTLEVIRSGVYKPLSRPLFLYINKASLQRPEVIGFLEFYIDNAKTIVENPHVGYVTLPEAVYKVALDRVKRGVTGSVMAAVNNHAGPVDLAKTFAGK